MNSIRYRHNPMELQSIASFVNIRGRESNGSKDVYFVRSLGFYQNLITDVQAADELLAQQMREGRLLYKRTDKLPVISSKDDIEYYSNAYEDWIAGGRLKLKIRATLSYPNLQERLSDACKESLAQYRAIKSGISPSIEKNYVVKLLHRLDVFLSDMSYSGEGKRIKIIAAEVDKEQDYLFFHLLTLMGMDVLLIQSGRDVPVQKHLLELSGSFVCGEFKRVELPPFQERAADVSIRREEAPMAEQVISRPTVYLPPRKDRKTRRAVTPGVFPQTFSGAQVEKSRTEKSFEDLANLASSVVMIDVCGRTGEVISTGSGIMVARGGYILTNNHVINKGYFYAINIEGEEKIYKTDEVIKYNTDLDLALIRIDRQLSPLPVYRGKEGLVRGQRVVAIGSPLGLFNSVSDGIISGFRVIDGVDMIQFTAPISHGSSGGAVLNMYGEVIGISTAGIDSGQNLNLAMGYEGINLFIRGFVESNT